MNEMFLENSPPSDFHLYPKVKNVIHKNEELLWINKPKQIPFILTANTFPLIVFGLLWTMLCWLGGANLFSLVGVIFICIGIKGYLERSNGFPETVFALTKNRVLIRTGTRWGVGIRCFDMESVLDVMITVSLLERFFNVGTVKFFIGETETDEGKEYKVYHCWHAIENPHQVYELVNNAIFERKNRISNPLKKKKKHVLNKESGYLLDYREK